MEIFKNKFLVKLIASICIFLTLLNFGMTKKVYAEDDDEVFGGALLGPIMNLLTGIADGIMDILHNTVLEQDESLIKLDGTADSWWNRHGASVIGWIVGIAIAAIIIITAIPSGGISIGAGAGILANISGVCFIIKGVAFAAIGGTIGGVVAGRVVEASMMADDIYLPVYNLSIQEIFANKLGLFDVNFFNPQQQEVIKKVKGVTKEFKSIYSIKYLSDEYAGSADLYVDSYDELIIGNQNIPSWMKLWDNSLGWLSITGYKNDLPSWMFEEGTQNLADSNLLQCATTSGLASGDSESSKHYKVFFEKLKEVVPDDIAYLNSDDILLGRCSMPNSGQYKQERYYIFQKSNDSVGIKIDIIYEPNYKERNSDDI